MKDSRNVRAAWRRVYVRLPWLLLLPAGLLVPRLCAGRAEAVETYFSGDLYHAIKNVLAALTSRFPFSLAEFLLYAIALVCTLAVLIDLIRVLAGKAPFAALVRRFVSLGIMAGALLLLFYATWGLNYFRVPLKTRLELNVCQRSEKELVSLSKKLVKRANKLRKSLPEDENGVATLPDGYRVMLDELPQAYEKLAADDPAFAGKVTRAKAVTWSKGLSWCGITGVYVGFTAEPNVNVDAPRFLLAHTAAHEMAHQLGIASEDEAEFTGFLACMKSDDASVQYAGILSMLIRCGNALHAVNAEAYEKLAAGYSDALIRDLRCQKDYWDAYEGAVQEQATKVNDGYLKHNAQQSGVGSYGEVVDMLLAYDELTDF